MTRFILTADEMRAAEAAAIAAGTPAYTLMERAGAGAAEAIWRFAGPMPALVLCGPGNNGGDGYVIARLLRARGLQVTVAALAEPRSDDAHTARAAWDGPVVALADAHPAPLLIDALFGTGLTRGLDAEVHGALTRLASAAQIRAAIDLPSGVATDDGRVLSPVPDCELTVTFGAMKPSHLLQPAARHMGRVVVADIGIEAASRLIEVARPRLRSPGPDDHKYTRGLVTIIAGAMPGASILAATAAARAGAGAVRLQAETVVPGVPAAIVQNGKGPLDRLDDPRIGALLAGCGLPADKGGRRLLDAALATGRPLVLDAGALQILADGGLERLADQPRRPILTPHDGEFAKLFGEGAGSKVERARAAAAAIDAVVVYKGADTVIAHPDGRAAICRDMSNWLASAGTGDVLAGIIAAVRAAGLPAFEAAQAGVWLQGRAAELAGPAFIADDLVAHLRQSYSECV
ncbi:NAD(P)H-hydrate dehydratase [Sphingosinicella sp. YJ22]|uniref:NAD(P)H-hydrate dehydratase n=1 Tax=Sphingosinicella sp. YJ22 TaxID=1104780 RepID=UPI002436116B|nr:NAD(P)H-hydrate dehydratase [Sphingosinicella sp. YJ22]